MSILVTRPLPQGEALVSRLRAMGRVAWSFPLIEFTPPTRQWRAGTLRRDADRARRQGHIL